MNVCVFELMVHCCTISSLVARASNSWKLSVAATPCCRHYVVALVCESLLCSLTTRRSYSCCAEFMAGNALPVVNHGWYGCNVLPQYLATCCRYSTCQSCLLELVCGERERERVHVCIAECGREHWSIARSLIHLLLCQNEWAHIQTLGCAKEWHFLSRCESGCVCVCVRVPVRVGVLCKQKNDFVFQCTFACDFVVLNTLYGDYGQLFG